MTSRYGEVKMAGDENQMTHEMFKPGIPRRPRVDDGDDCIFGKQLLGLMEMPEKATDMGGNDFKKQLQRRDITPFAGFKQNQIFNNILWYTNKTSKY